MKIRYILETVVVVVIVAALLVFQHQRTSKDAAPHQPAAPKAEPHGSAMTQFGPTSDEIMAVMALDKKKAEETSNRIFNAWQECLKNDTALRALIHETAGKTGMPEDNPEVLKAPPVREYLYKQAEDIYAQSGLDPKAKRGLFFTTLDRIVRGKQ